MYIGLLSLLIATGLNFNIWNYEETTFPFLTHIFPLFCKSSKHFVEAPRWQKSGTQYISNQFRLELHQVSYSVGAHK